MRGLYPVESISIVGKICGEVFNVHFHSQILIKLVVERMYLCIIFRYHIWFFSVLI